MARIKQDTQLKDRTSRAKLKVQREPYWMVLEKGRSLGYRKGKKGGEWFARYYDPLLKPSKIYRPLGSADDHGDPDGTTVLSFTQAQAAARTWFEVAYHQATGETIKSGTFTVHDAVDLYLADRKRQGAKTADRMGYDFNAHVLPALGDIAIERLTRKRIEDWLVTVAESPIRRRGKEGEAPSTDAEKRSRKATANRVWTLLRAALNHAAEEKGYTDGGWAGVKAFRGTQVARIRFLSVTEQVRLVNACSSDDFRALIRAALFTGAREGEIARLTARDFDQAQGSVFIEFSKSGPSRRITLTAEGAAFFTERCTGLEPTAVLFPRKTYDRKEKNTLGTWSRPELCRMMRDTCTTASLDPLTFHELRHTYASGLVNCGVPLVFVAQQLGHRDTRMVEKHYGHLCQSAKADAVRKLAPMLGIHTPDLKVQTLKIKT